MTYSESEHSVLLNKINCILEDEKLNPLEAFFGIKKLMTIFNKIPVYPGVVPDIFEKSNYEVEGNKLEKGDYIILYEGKDCYAGTVKEISETGTLRLNYLGKITNYKSKTFKIEEIKKIYCINERPRKEIVAVQSTAFAAVRSGESMTVKSENIAEKSSLPPIVIPQAPPIAAPVITDDKKGGASNNA